MSELHERPIAREFDRWREADQRYYVSDIRCFEDVTGWRPRIGLRDGVRSLHEWLVNAREPHALEREALARRDGTQVPS
jgi:CDP-paratose 2-epimerase